MFDYRKKRMLENAIKREEKSTTLLKKSNHQRKSKA